MFPELEPYRVHRLSVSAVHDLYVEESGQPDGIPVVYLHGGPGEGSRPRHRSYFDPARYRIILLDQRGCGRSTPHACTNENTTNDLVADLERVRQHLSITRWLVFGGSWGSTLGLAYSQAHPASVSGLVLWGIFLGRKRELAWYYQSGARFLFPEAWSRMVEVLSPTERRRIIAAFHRRVNSVDPSVQLEAAVAWSQWEGATINLLQDPQKVMDFGDPKFALAFARLETHYFINSCFLRPNQLLRNVSRIRHIPARLIHGRYDVATPVVGAIELHREWPEAALQIVPDAGHSSTEPGIRSALLAAAREFTGEGFQPA